MGDISRIISRLGRGEPADADQLLPLVYDELRRLAAAKLAHERAGQTLEATALVHEAYVRLVGQPQSTRWEGRSHFFAAAAEAMRRILVEQARRKSRLKHGGHLQRVVLAEPADFRDDAQEQLKQERILQIDAALSRLAQEDALAARIVTLHYFAGLSLSDVAEIVGISRATAYRHWTYAKSWIQVSIRAES
jgi:RNA polymerase sigma factor (TIGR02999 family)